MNKREPGRTSSNSKNTNNVNSREEQQAEGQREQEEEPMAPPLSPQIPQHAIDDEEDEDRQEGSPRLNPGAFDEAGGGSGSGSGWGQHDEAMIEALFGNDDEFGNENEVTAEKKKKRKQPEEPRDGVERGGAQKKARTEAGSDEEFADDDAVVGDEELEDVPPPDYETEEGGTQPIDDIDKEWKEEVLGKVRRQRRSSSAGKTVPPDSEMIQDFVLRMEAAYEQDADAYKANEPALNKLKMLPEVVATLQKQQVREGFFEAGLLRICRNWLKPLADGTLPNLRIREGILKSLGKIDLTQEQLQRSGIGKIIMILSRHKQESNANKKICRELIMKWSAPIFEVNSSYRDTIQPEPEKQLRRSGGRRRSSGLQKQGLDAALEKSDEIPRDTPEKLGNLYYNRPDKARMDYVRRPSSEWTDPVGKKQDKKPKGGLQERMALIKSRPTAKRAVSVGINKIPSNIV